MPGLIRVAKPRARFETQVRFGSDLITHHTSADAGMLAGGARRFHPVRVLNGSPLSTRKQTDVGRSGEVRKIAATGWPGLP